jgi:hypothetical protein
MQISRDDNEQSVNMKTSSETSEREIDQQTEHINDFNRIHLRREHRRSSSHLFDHCTVSIYLLCLDLIRSQRRTRLQAKEECRVDLYERHSNSSSSDHFRNFQIHRRNRSECKALFVLDTSTARHDHLRRAITSDHHFDVFLHQESQNASQSISRSQSDAASAHALRSAKFSTEAEN